MNQQPEADADERARLMGQMRMANERLLLATLRAEEVAADAEALAADAEVARESAAYNEARFRALAATAATIIWEANAAGLVTADGDSWERFTGTAFDGTHPAWGWLVAVHPSDRDNVRSSWAHAVATSQPYVCAYRIATASGYGSVVSRAVPIMVAGHVREWIGMMIDVTDSVRIEEAREQFIGILGHDLRNPLAAISLGAEAFRELPDPYGSVAAQMLRSVHRMEVMIRDVMDFTRGRLGGGIPVAMGPCNLGEIAHEVTAEIRTAHPRRDITCVTSDDLAGTCDNARAEQVFSNLLGNAVSHGADPIRLTVVRAGDEILISVHNGGPPIPAHVLPRLFEPFTRGYAPDEARASKGLGLGLYIVHEIVAAHGGAVSVSSSAAEGTTMAVRWPRHARPRA